MSLTDLAPEPLHVTRRGNALVITGGHLLDMSPRQASWLEDRLQELIDREMPGAHVRVDPVTKTIPTPGTRTEGAPGVGTTNSPADFPAAGVQKPAAVTA